MSLLAGIATFEALYRRLMSPFQRPVPILPLPTDKTICFLVDNGSLRAASFRNLRKAARLVQEKLGDSVAAVVPVSIRFSDRVPLKRLDGVAGEVLVDAIQRAIEAGYTSFIIVPFFIGPSSQLTDTIPDMLMPIAREFPAITLRLATSLMDPFLYPSDRRLALALAARVTSAAAEHSLNPASVPVYCALIDHGSPSPRVTHVRNLLASHLQTMLGNQVTRVYPCSMERRPQAEYDFNEPLLENLADFAQLPEKCVVLLALAFLSPGRHAGKAGDIDQILKQLKVDRPGITVIRCELLGLHPVVVDILAERCQQALKATECLYRGMVC